MTLNLTEHTVNTENVVKNVVEKDERDIKFFFVEHPETLLCVFAKDLTIHGDIVLRSPVGE
jgi:hypothetical protein